MGGRRISLTSANDADVRIVVKNKKVTIRLELPERTTRRLLTQLRNLRRAFTREIHRLTSRAAVQFEQVSRRQAQHVRHGGRSSLQATLELLVATLVCRTVFRGHAGGTGKELGVSQVQQITEMECTMKIRVVIEPSDEGGYTVHVPSLPGCISEGETVQEALENVHEAIELSISSRSRTSASERALVQEIEV